MDTNNNTIQKASVFLTIPTLGDTNCHKKFDINRAPIVSPGQPPPNTQSQCIIFPSKNDLDIFDNVDIKVNNVAPGNDYYADVTEKNSRKVISDKTAFQADRTGNVTIQLNKRPQKLPAGDYSVQVYKQGSPINPICLATQDFTVKGTITAPIVKQCGDGKGDTIICSSGGGDPCDTGDNRGPAFKTAIGCIHTSPPEFVKDLITFVIGIGGGLAFLMMLLGAYQMLSSAGNPETLKAGQDRLTSAIRPKLLGCNAGLCTS